MIETESEKKGTFQVRKVLFEDELSELRCVQLAALLGSGACVRCA